MELHSGFFDLIVGKKLWIKVMMGSITIHATSAWIMNIKKTTMRRTKMEKKTTNYTIHKLNSQDAYEKIHKPLVEQDKDFVVLLGLDMRCLDDYANWLNNNGGLKDNAEFFHITGYEFNDFAKRVYPDDLNIVVLNLCYIENIGKLAISRLNVDGLKWLSDIA